SGHCGIAWRDARRGRYVLLHWSLRNMQYRWSDITSEQVLPTVSRRFVNTKQMTVARFELAAGTFVSRHSHANEQVTFVLSGRLEVATDAGTFVVGPGEFAVIDGGVGHETKALEATIAVDVFCPNRQDWSNR